MCFYHIVVGHSFHFIQTGCALLTKLCSFQIHCSTLSPNGSISISVLMLLMIEKDGSHSLRNICCDIEIGISFNL